MDWLRKAALYILTVAIFWTISLGTRLSGIDLTTPVGIFLATISLAAIMLILAPIGYVQWQKILYYLGLAYLTAFLGSITGFEFHLGATITAAILAIIVTYIDSVDGFEDFPKGTAFWYGITAFTMVFFNLG